MSSLITDVALRSQRTVSVINLTGYAVNLLRDDSEPHLQVSRFPSLADRRPGVPCATHEAIQEEIDVLFVRIRVVS
jgi:hypothetical protein